jgi:hypothetical protein
VSTFSRVVGETLAPLVNVRDTAEMETPAKSATSRAVTRRSEVDRLVAFAAAALRFLRKRLASEWDASATGPRSVGIVPATPRIIAIGQEASAIGRKAFASDCKLPPE